MNDFFDITKTTGLNPEQPAGIGDNSAALANVDRLAELRREIKSTVWRIEGKFGRIASSIVECGNKLIEARKLVEETGGTWHKWLRTNTEISIRTSQRWIKAATESCGETAIRADLCNLTLFTNDEDWVKENVYPYEARQVSPPNEAISVGADTLPVPRQTKRTEPKVQVKTASSTDELPAGTPQRKGRGPTRKMSVSEHQRTVKLLREHNAEERKEYADWGNIEITYIDFIRILLQTLKGDKFSGGAILHAIDKMDTPRKDVIIPLVNDIFPDADDDDEEETEE